LVNLYLFYLFTELETFLEQHVFGSLDSLDLFAVQVLDQVGVLDGVVLEVVLLETGLVQVLAVAAVEDTQEAVPDFGLRMDLQVLLEIGAARKHFHALIATEWLLASVDPLMTDQVRRLAKTGIAARVLAEKWFFFIVDSDVFLQRAKLGECLAAILTKFMVNKKILKLAK